MESISKFIESGEIWPSLIVIIGAIAAGIIVSIIAFFIIKKIVRYSLSDNAWVILSKLKYPVTMLITLLLLTIVLPFLNFTEGLTIIVRHIITIFYIISFSWIMIQAVRISRILLLMKYDIEAKDNLQARKVYTQFRILQQLLITLIVILAIAVALMTFDRVKQLGVSLLASAGLAGLIIGFAAQKSIGNVIAGLQIALTQPIRLDDVVIVEGEWGKIEEITLTYVVVKIWDERRLVLPINYFIENPFQNWTRTSSQILGTIYLYTDYRMPVEPIRKELSKILSATKHWDKRVDVLQVTDAKENVLELRALVSASDASTAWDLRVFTREKLIEFIQREYPQYLPQTRVTFTEDKA